MWISDAHAFMQLVLLQNSDLKNKEKKREKNGIILIIPQAVIVFECST